MSRSLNKAASCGDNCIKTYDLQDIKDVESIMNLDDVNQTSLHQLSWSEDGQLLAQSTVNGGLHVFLTKLPLLASVHTHKIAYMTSLKEISIYDHLSKTKVLIHLFYSCLLNKNWILIIPILTYLTYFYRSLD